MNSIKQTYEMSASICNHFLVKCLGALTYIFYSFSFNVLHEASMLAVLLLIIFDFITGIIAAKLSGDEIKSKKIFRSALKVMFYFMLISGGHLTEKAVGINLFLDETMIAFLATTELISVLENIGRMGFAVPKKLLNKLEDFRGTK